MSDQASWDGPSVNDIEIELDSGIIGDNLLQDQKFIDAVAKAVRNQMLKDVRTMKTLFAQWGGTSK
jgi:hypothetical protein